MKMQELTICNVNILKETYLFLVSPESSLPGNKRKTSMLDLIQMTTQTALPGYSNLYLQQQLASNCETESH
jgi:hypothetical protein